MLMQCRNSGGLVLRQESSCGGFCGALWLLCMASDELLGAGGQPEFLFDSSGLGFGWGEGDWIKAPASC